ncbi:inner-membrane-bound regulator [Metschnikowia aff. pulcherrima]|uniref:Inner-membrane-bound regulator n=1 Tax=Metschnikowia aff. pulcherrima TaxID=2163413 RepID=A0A4P6XKY6_9ASCO|nr:inner-membrane-bound regulator [Metschnikowia aff. pulcherrima]
MFRRLPFGLRAPLKPCLRINTLRSFSHSKAVFSDIHSEILSILQEEPPAEPEKPAKKKNILILSPEQTKNRDYATYMMSLAKKERRAKKVTRVKAKMANLELDLRPEDFAETNLQPSVSEMINGFRESTRGKFSVKQAVQNLAKSFTRAQLADYVKETGASYYRASHNKTKLAETIVSNIWAESGTALSSVFYTERVPLSHQEMFLLLSQRGAILRLLKATVTSLDFDSTNRELVMVGTERQIENAKVNLTHRFEQAVREEIDLGSIRALYDEKFGRFTFKEIGQLIEVYFQHLHGDTYELCALDATQVRRIKRLLVWFLDYNKHCKSALHTPSPETLANLSLVPHCDDYSMLWKDRSKAHFRLVDETRSVENKGQLSREIEHFSEENLAKISESIDFDVSREYFSESGATDETFESLTSVLEDDLETVIEDITGAKVEPNTGDKAKFFSESKKQALYEELTDFLYRKDLDGVNESELDAPIFTVTLGQVLFTKERAKNTVLTAAPQKSELCDFTFSTNVSLAYDKLLHEGFADSEGLPHDDPHMYNLQLKFLPLPYVEDTKTALSTQKKYPPVELWMPLNDNKVVDIESLQIVTVEGENDSYVCMPSCGTDVKITCQMTGRLIKDEPQIEPESDQSLEPNMITESGESLELPDTTETHEKPALDQLFGAISSKYPKLAQQPGVQTFLQNLRLDFSGKALTLIAPYIDVLMDGKSVRYDFVSVNYRREIDLEIGDNQLVQVSIVDGGLLGGRRAEIRFIGDFTKGLDRPAFDQLLDSTCAFVESL